MPLPPSIPVSNSNLGQVGDYESIVSQYHQFNTLKETYPNIKTLISVGGGVFNNPGPTLTRFLDTAKTAAQRKRFAASCVKFCRTYNFNGVGNILEILQEVVILQLINGISYYSLRQSDWPLIMPRKICN